MDVRFYNPSHFRVDDPELLARAVNEIVFGTLISTGAEGLAVSHAPFLLDRAAGPHGTLYAHLARANPHHESLDGADVLVLFQGPHHYVPPAWYATKRTTGRVVPTWNYVVVHARGVARTFDDPERLDARVRSLTDHMEGRRVAPWRVDDAPPDHIAQLTGHIVGVDVALTALEGKYKLGQNRRQEDRASLAEALAQEAPALHAALDQLYPPR